MSNNKYVSLIVLVTLFVSMFIASNTAQASVQDAVRGRIVLQVEENGEAWYVDPSNSVRYYLGRPDDAFAIMRERGLGITNEDLSKIPITGTTWDANADLMNRVSGRILLQVEENGEAWYVYPGDQRRYYLGRPDDAFAIMRELGLGITNADLEAIPTEEQQSTQASYSNYTIQTEAGSFAVHVVAVPRSSAQLVTDTGTLTDCANNCYATSLENYIAENSAIAGIHGTYFCPPDYSNCSSSTYSFNPPFYNSAAGIMINEDKLPFHSGPMIAVATDGTYYYYHRTIDFGYTVQEWESKTGKTLQAAAANYPSLVEGGNIIVQNESIEASQQVKGNRGGIGYSDSTVYLVVASSASVPDMAYIFKALSVDYAMNLDGGGSTALYSNGAYNVGPGRLLPNAIVFR